MPKGCLNGYCFLKHKRTVKDIKEKLLVLTVELFKLQYEDRNTKHVTHNALFTCKRRSHASCGGPPWDLTSEKI